MGDQVAPKSFTSNFDENRDSNICSWYSCQFDATGLNYGQESRIFLIFW
jgi:hypothetical protein